MLVMGWEVVVVLDCIKKSSSLYTCSHFLNIMGGLCGATVCDFSCLVR